MSSTAVIEVRHVDAGGEGRRFTVYRRQGTTLALADRALELRTLADDLAVLAGGGAVIELAVGERATLEDGGGSWQLRLLAIEPPQTSDLPGSTPVERELLAEIRAAPEDASALTVYADWLGSQPAQVDRDRGELIHVQCALAAGPDRDRRRALRERERALLVAQPPPAFGAGVRLELAWSRGLLARCRGALADFARHVSEVFQLAPLLGDLDLTVHPWNRTGLDKLARFEPLGQIRELALTPELETLASGDAVLQALCPALTGLRRVRVTSLRIGAAGVRALLGAGAARYAAIDLSGNAIGIESVRALAACTELEPSVLRLAACELGRLDVETLAAAPWIDALEELDLGNNDLRDPRGRALAQLPARQLRRLALGSCGIGPAVGEALLRSPPWRRLRELRLHGNPIGDRGLIALAGARVHSIAELDVQSCAIGPAGIAELAASPAARALRRLRLGRNPIGDAGASAIAGSRHLTGVERLELSHCGITDDGAIALADSAPPARELDLAGNAIGDRGAEALVACAAAHVRLAVEGLSGSTARRVRERFGPA